MQMKRRGFGTTAMDGLPWGTPAPPGSTLSALLESAEAREQTKGLQIPVSFI